MIRFTCPTCSTLHQAPDDQAGAKVSCSRCAQRLRIPALPAPPSPTARTVLGRIEDFPLPTAARPPPLPPALPIESTVVYCRRCGKLAPSPVPCSHCSAVCCSEVCVVGHLDLCPKLPTFDSMTESPPVRTVTTRGKVVQCPGCARHITLEAAFLSLTIQSALVATPCSTRKRAPSRNRLPRRRRPRSLTSTGPRGARAPVAAFAASTAERRGLQRCAAESPRQVGSCSASC